MKSKNAPFWQELKYLARKEHFFMGALLKEVIREIISENKFSNAGE